MEEIIKFYNYIDEELRFKRNSRKIEFLTSVNVLDKILDNNSRILDLGAGTGAYSFYFANKGHEVTAVDLTPRNVELINSKINDNLKLSACVGNATDLSQFETNFFDSVLCFGPMYHLISESDRRSCISECLRVLKPNGSLAVAYINKYSVIPMLVRKEQAFIKESVIHKVVSKGVIKAGDPDCFWTDAFFTTPDDLENYLTDFGVKVIDHLGTDGLSHTLSDEIDNLTDEQYNLWFEYHKTTCRERTILGTSSHGLVICRK
jgi:2-polyprenyl-3-methyl-5-hydroxy-6-metoxy-1,4-benzoquinol methylase